MTHPAAPYGVLLALLSLGCSSQPKPAPQARLPPAESAPVAPAPAAPDPAEPLPDADLQPGEEPLLDIPETAPGPELAPELSETEETGAESEAAMLLHESLEAFEAAEVLRKQGAVDEALAALDGAYARMAEVLPDGDPVLAQEKENLRRLIARRVVEIYAARQVAVGDPNDSIPITVNDDVRREIALFQGRERQFFLESYRRSGLYRPMIVGQLREAGLPESLSWLPLVESGFKERALSSARALGLWQFIPSTGYRYGLDRSDWIDERMDPVKATQAAIQYLTALHGLFGDWMTALAGYNCGEHAVLRQIQNQSVSYFDQFWDLYARLPGETRRYVPRFLATLAILENPAEYGFELPEPLPPLLFETVEIARATKLESLDRALGLEAGALSRLNPELRRNATPNSTYALKVPPGSAPTVQASVAALPKYEPPPLPATTTHRVRSGETLSMIAARYRSSVRELLSLNRLRSANRLSIGQRLTVPARGAGALSSVAPTAPTAALASIASGAAPSAGASGREVRHQVRSGESLWILASRYDTTVERIRRDNGLSGNALRPGQVLKIRSGTAGG